MYARRNDVIITRDVNIRSTFFGSGWSISHWSLWE